MSSYISQAFDHWVAGLPTEVLIPAIMGASVAWLFSLAQVARRKQQRGAE